MSRVMRKPTFWFPTRSDTNQALQLQKMARVLKFQNKKVLLLVWVEALRPSQQCFSHVGTEPPLPGYYQYFLGGKCILLKDTTRRPLATESEAPPLGHRASPI